MTMFSINHRAVALLAVVVCLLSGCGFFFNDDSTRLRHYTPAELGGTVDVAGEVEVKHIVRIRVYADEAYRDRNLRWEDKFTAQITRANRVVGPRFGVRFEVESFRPWSHNHGDSDDMGEVLAQLEALDDGAGVDTVVGLVAALPVFSASFHNLGMARILGRHFVLRGMNDLAERKYLSRELDDISDTKTELLYRNRKQHKETAVFLHEWGHTMGAIHTNTDAWIMSGLYDDEQALFCSANGQLIEIALNHPDVPGKPETRKARAAALLDAVAKGDGGKCWEHDEKMRMAEVMEDVSNTFDAPRAAPLTPKQTEVYNRAVSLMRIESYGPAWDAFEPLSLSRADHPSIQFLACELASLQDAGPEPGPICLRAMALNPREARPAIRLAQDALEAGDHTLCDEMLAEAHRRLSAAKTPEPNQWLFYADLLQMARRMTESETIATRFKDEEGAQNILDAIARFRTRNGLPHKQSGVDPKDEAAVLRALDPLRDGIWDGSASTKAALDTLEKRFPDALPIQVARCVWLSQSGRDALARKVCRAAIERDPASSSAHYFLAVTDARGNRIAPAIEHLKIALASDPKWQGPWIFLGRLYKASNRKKEGEALGVQYQERFGKALDLKRH